jgi:hypothetical protein
MPVSFNVMNARVSTGILADAVHDDKRRGEAIGASTVADGL